MRRYWVGVASRDHVQVAVNGGFAQLNHGKEAPLRRLQPGDALLYYSPREQISGGVPLQAFTALGKVLEGEPYQVRQSDRFSPFRRAVLYRHARDAPIRPLLQELDFSRGDANWGRVLRRGTFLITESDYRTIAAAMGVDEERRVAASPSDGLGTPM